MPFEVGAGYDPVGGPEAGLELVQFKELRVAGELIVEGQRPEVVSAGEAVDAVLNDLHFVHWLEAQPVATWSNANLMLQSHPTAEGIVPAGPTWAVELFREVGVPRHWAIAHVNAISGELIRIDYCDIPCGR